jgi:hypothetical protein
MNLSSKLIVKGLVYLFGEAGGRDGPQAINLTQPLTKARIFGTAFYISVNQQLQEPQISTMQSEPKSAVVPFSVQFAAVNVKSSPFVRVLWLARTNMNAAVTFASSSLTKSTLVALAFSLQS